MFEKTFIIFALLVVFVGVGANYVSPRAARVSRAHQARQIEAGDSGVYGTPNVKPSDLEMMKRIFGSDSSQADASTTVQVILKEEDSGSLSIHTSGTKAFTKKCSFLLPSHFSN